MAELSLHHIFKSYRNNEFVIEDFNLHIQEGEFIVIVGPSGSGKSTILRMIAGLEEISAGTFLIGEKRMNNVAARNRDVAFVFQNYALYPHMNVYENMAFGLKNHRFSKGDIKQRVNSTAQLLELHPYLTRKPAELSGGEQQRVALGRALVRDAKVFLMDEPLSNLDAKLRVQMRSEITRLHQRLKTTTIYVTHDQTEALTMASRLVVMNDGVIQQIDVPQKIYENPANMFVGGFIGTHGMNFFKGVLIDSKITIGEDSIRVPEIKNKALFEAGYSNKEIIIGIRPEHFFVDTHQAHTSHFSEIDVKLERNETLESETILQGYLNKQALTARVGVQSNQHFGQSVQLSVNTDKIHFFDPETEKQILFTENREID